MNECFSALTFDTVHPLEPLARVAPKAERIAAAPDKPESLQASFQEGFRNAPDFYFRVSGRPRLMHAMQRNAMRLI